ncbi:capsular biosynthesis protein [Enterovibrio norvegicus]|uniref:polysaccharide biosynthesis/export family protein n=1 Tax=Enterovibrio norvegicus TaxID=188144 RepID=UPI00036D5CAF|nr:polysaccharide biosynthesis/export family protein [Enterovibrio norvegicus]MCC4799494.1 polysaccharide export protein [Enterovibrio norvegicus]OEE51834.1 capsular biosynthesis protein [Enterovibrio norvegicus]PMH64837.1 capsular biosynthesis protein [Enterovibrio norvegicus]PMI31566.1 capsular biosynthesis protein [Enterovibrio norvegicus]PMI36800.1 capsular biosynthesis protein [Enterovibrio norvegicus]
MQKLLWIWMLLFSMGIAHAETEQYVLDDGDRISIKVYGEEDLSMDILLSTQGRFDYPYLGRLQAAGKTVGQVQSTIEKGLRGDFLIDPKVTVNVIQFRKFYVNGEVNHPGGYDFQPGLTVAKAIAIAGGFTDRASRNKIQKTDSKKSTTQKNVGLSQSVGPGDIIVVEQSFF